MNEYCYTKLGSTKYMIHCQSTRKFSFLIDHKWLKLIIYQSVFSKHFKSLKYVLIILWNRMYDDHIENLVLFPNKLAKAFILQVISVWSAHFYKLGS